MDTTSEPWNELPEPMRTAAKTYKPKVLTQEQWAVLRVPVLALVGRCEPKFKKEVAMLAGNLCMLLAAYASEVPELSVDALLTQQNLDRLLVKNKLEGMKESTQGQVAVRLRRMLRVHTCQPKPPPVHARPVQAGAPYTLDEVTQLVDVVDAGPSRVRRAGLSALLLGLGYGVVVPDTKHLTLNDDGLAFKGQQLAPPPAGLPEALTRRDAVLKPVSTADWEGLRAWLKWEHPDLELTAQRLRDTWLSQRCADAATPVVVLMAENGVGRSRLVRVAAEPVPDDDARLGLLLDF